MTRIAVHALGTRRLLVCGDDGRRWTINAAASRLGDPDVQDALTSLRKQRIDVQAASWDGLGVTISCLRNLAKLAATPSTTVRWTFAGRVYRMMLPSDNSEAAVKEVVELLLATVADAEEATALSEPPLLDEITEGTGTPPLLATASPAKPGMLERWTDGSWRPHRLRPPPLVDPVTGILHRIVERHREPDSPSGFTHLHAELPHLSSIDHRFQPDPLAPAGAFREAATSPQDEAVLSGVAHECGAYLGQGILRVATAAELRAEGEHLLTVSEWCPHAPRLHEIPGFPFVRDHEQLRMPWLKGSDHRGACWAPLSLVHAGYLASGLDDLPPTNGHNLVGLQAGFTEEQALERAAGHVIAQDAVARWWNTGPALPEATLPDIVRAAWANSPWLVRVLRVPTRFTAPVRLAMVDDPSGGIVALGYACASTAEEAATRAVAEALIQHASARDLSRPDSLIRNAATLGNGGVAGLAPYDPERGYAHGFADHRWMIDPMCHIQYGLDPRIVAHTRQRLTPSIAPTEPPPVTNMSPLRTLTRARTRLVHVDVTTSRVKAAGARAVRLLAPTLQRLSPSAFEIPDRQATHPYPGW